MVSNGMVKWVIGAILLLPFAELVVFIAVAATIGLFHALGLMLATTLVGLLLLRHAGRTQIARFRDAVTETGGIGIEVGTGSFLVVLAGLLLFLPGFLTDAIGLLLLIGPLRRILGGMVRRWAGQGAGPDAGPDGRRGGNPSVVDLEPDEWRQVPDRELQNRSSKRRDD
jgi:UPF0716 protein FxsA